MLNICHAFYVFLKSWIRKKIIFPNPLNMLKTKEKFGLQIQQIQEHAAAIPIYNN